MIGHIVTIAKQARGFNFYASRVIWYETVMFITVGTNLELSCQNHMFTIIEFPTKLTK